MMRYELIQTYIIVIIFIVGSVNLCGLFIRLPIFTNLEFSFTIKSYIVHDS